MEEIKVFFTGRSVMLTQKDDFRQLVGKVKNIHVGDIMTTDVVTIHPNNHVLLIVDLMLKKHIRHLPVVEGDNVVGIVYVSDIFYQLMGRIVEPDSANQPGL